MSPSLVCLFLLHLTTSCANAQQQSFSQIIRTKDDNVTVDFQLFPIRSSNFRVLVQNASGSFSLFTAQPSGTYLGTVRGQPGAMASALRRADGTLLCRVSFESGVEWSSLTGSDVASVRGSTNWKPQWPTSVVPPTSGNAALSVAEAGVDATYVAFTTAGSSVARTVEVVEFSVLAANVPFLRDASILHNIGVVVIRSSQATDPYNGSADTGFLLNTVRSQWNTDISSVVGKTQHLALVTSPGAGGGLAYVGAIATSNAYSANGADDNGDFSVIWRHEAGHNWGSNHYEGGGRPEGPTIMSDNSLSRFSSSELAKILANKNKVPTSSMVIPRPPRANMDLASVQCQQPVTIDVLANDLDANYQSLKIAAAATPTPLDSTVRVSSSSGARDKLVYTPSPQAAVSVDYFSYQISNGLGKTATGYVAVRPSDLVGWWKLDENSGTSAGDSSGNAADGSVSGTTSWAAEGGLVFSGAGKVSFDTKPSLQGTTSFTVAAWIKVPSSSTSTGVILQQRSPQGFNGEYIFSISGGKPNFMVFGDGGYQFDFSALAAVNDGQWHHVVAVRNYKEGRVYVDGTLSASASGQVRSLDGSIAVFMGWDARDNTSYFQGTIMGVRLYSRALFSEEIEYLSTRPESLVAWWKLDERSGSSVADSSANGATGSISGSATWSDGSLVFDGSSGKVAFGTKPSLAGRTDFTVSAWVKVPSDATSTGVILQQRSPPDGDTSGFVGQYIFSISNGRPKFTVFGSGGWQFDFSTSAAINDNAWHHVMAVREQKQGQIYVDGKLSGSANGNSVESLDEKIAVFMGWDGRDNVSFFKGSLKQVKVYNLAILPKALSALVAVI